MLRLGWQSRAGTTSAPPNFLHVTDACANQLRQLADNHSERVIPALRVLVDTGGCSGFQYRFMLEHDAPRLEDVVFETNGVKIYVDSMSAPFLSGATIDFEEELIRSAFKVERNPNSEASCSCGSSFTPKG